MTPRFRNVVIAMGNPLLCDDSAALLVLEDLRRMPDLARTNLVENHSSGMDLLPEMIDRDHVLVIDAVFDPDLPPGACREYDLEDLAATNQPRLVDTHGLNLATVVRTGFKLGYPMPHDIQILGIAGRDFTTFQEHPHDNVRARLPEVAKRVVKLVGFWESESGRNPSSVLNFSA